MKNGRPVDPAESLRNLTRIVELLDYIGMDLGIAIATATATPTAKKGKDPYKIRNYLLKDFKRNSSYAQPNQLNKIISSLAKLGITEMELK